MHNSDANKSACRIILDAMGGDHAPHNVVLGAVEALKVNPSLNLRLIGIKSKILDVLHKNNLTFDENNIIDTPEVIEMGDSPTQSLKQKRNSSIVVGAQLVKEKSADAFVSAGNTGAMMAASTLIMGRIPGIGRPTIGSIMPNAMGITTVFDVGASVDSKPIHLLEYAIMGSIFTKEIFGIKNPSVGILSVGEEETKGNEASIEAAKLIRKTNLNFLGNVEGRDILNGSVNVVVCDGFTGNIILKFGEGVLTFLKTKMKNYASTGLLNKIKVGIAYSALKNILKDFDYQEYGGVPLLGVNGISIIGHGSSTPKAIKNMVLRAEEMHRKDLINKIENSIKQYSNL
ncbi:MAG TPA: phosphate acyltransferase PlsX [Ignavibacteriaceae bacterium]|nr:phosphate acyltransferase PlsX [Ignavibacteriaceae bacterium]